MDSSSSSADKIPSTATARNLADLNFNSSEEEAEVIKPSPIKEKEYGSSDGDEGEIDESMSCDASSDRKRDFVPNTSYTKPSVKSTGALLLPQFVQIASKFAFGAIVTLYILNQQHALPKPLSAVVSKTLFWPTLPITMSKRIAKWTTVIDDSVLLGGAPFGWLNYPQRLYEDHNVRGVINMCEEYQGPVKQYEKLGIKELRLPTTDHFEPSVEDMKSAVEFIKSYKENDLGKVYIHCRAGHGRSAAIVYGWLMSQEDDIDSLDMKKLNEEFCQLRNVRKYLHKQPNVNEFRSWLSFKRKNEVFDERGEL